MSWEQSLSNALRDVPGLFLPLDTIQGVVSVAFDPASFDSSVLRKNLEAAGWKIVEEDIFKGQVELENENVTVEGQLDSLAVNKRWIFTEVK